MFEQVIWKESEFLALHLTGSVLTENVRPKIELLYSSTPLSPVEQSLWETMLRYPFLISWIEGGSKLTGANQILLGRLNGILAISEVSPQNANRFLPARLGFPDFAMMLVWGAIGVVRSIIGGIFLKLFNKTSK